MQVVVGILNKLISELRTESFRKNQVYNNKVKDTQKHMNIHNLASILR